MHGGLRLHNRIFEAAAVKINWFELAFSGRRWSASIGSFYKLEFSQILRRPHPGRCFRSGKIGRASFRRRDCRGFHRALTSSKRSKFAARACRSLLEQGSDRSSFFSQFCDLRNRKPSLELRCRRFLPFFKCIRIGFWLNLPNAGVVLWLTRSLSETLVDQCINGGCFGKWLSSPHRSAHVFVNFHFLQQF